MNQSIELEISLGKRREGVYSLELRYREADSEADIHLDAGQTGDLHLDLGQLQFQIFDPESYANALTTSFFSAEAVRAMFDRARASAERLDRPLRVRLVIDPGAPELDGVYWELLRDAQDDTPLFLGENIAFSRYLSSAAWRKVRLRPKSKLRALVMIANPSDLADYPGLAPIPVEDQLESVRQSLGDIPITALGGSVKRASLANLVAALQAEKPDILYLVCHGALRQGQPYLWLENEQGASAVTSGEVLLTRLQELSDLPLLAVLASCQSAGSPTEAEFRTALGPRLSQAGIPAVVAMQGDISQETVAEFMAVFFAALQKDGRVDHAMALGRGCVRQRADYWMPVLFSRLRSGVIFAEPEAARRPVRLGWVNWVILTSIFLLGIGAVIGYLAWPREKNMRVQEQCSLCIAVAGFQQIGSTDEKNLGKNISAEISGLLDQNLAELGQNTSNIIKVWGPNEIDTLQADDTQKLDNAAGKLAREIGADILVYGIIDTSQEDWKVEPRFVISPDYFFKDLIDIIGQHQLGSPYDIKENTDAIRRQMLRQTNSQRSRLLATIVLGETYVVLSEYEKALEVFQSIEKDLDTWEDPAVNKLVTLLMGNAAGRYSTQVKSPELLKAAEDYYNKAINADPDYARAYLGLASVAYSRALEKIYQSENPNDLEAFTLLDTDQAEKSLAFTEKAAQRFELPDLAHVQEKVHFGLGQIYFAQILHQAMVTMENQSFQPAINEYNKVIEAYQVTKDEVLIELAAESHAQLGLIYSLTDEIDAAIDHYRLAIQLNHDPLREKAFKEKLAELK